MRSFQNFLLACSSAGLQSVGLATAQHSAQKIVKVQSQPVEISLEGGRTSNLVVDGRRGTYNPAPSSSATPPKVSFSSHASLSHLSLFNDPGADKNHFGHLSRQILEHGWQVTWHCYDSRRPMKRVCNMDCVNDETGVRKDYQDVISYVYSKRQWESGTMDIKSISCTYNEDMACSESDLPQSGAGQWRCYDFETATTARRECQHVCPNGEVHVRGVYCGKHGWTSDNYNLDFVYYAALCKDSPVNPDLQWKPPPAPQNAETNVDDTDINFTSEDELTIDQVFSVAKSSLAFPIIVEHGDIIQYGASNILEVFLSQMSVAYEAVISHGCWCARLNPGQDQNILGGSKAIDELDGLCKEWVNSRYCNTLTGGTCNAQIDGPYHLDFNSTDDFKCVDSADCLQDSCQIDGYYGIEIMQWLIDNEGQLDSILKTVQDGDCSNVAGGAGGGLGKANKACTGTIPDQLQIVVDSSVL